jgi:hypothetical protein
MLRDKEYGPMPSVMQVDVKRQVKSLLARDHLSLNEQTKQLRYLMDRRGNKLNESNNDPSRELLPRSETTHSRSTSTTRTTPSLISTDSHLEIQSCHHKAASSLRKGCKPWPGPIRFRDKLVVGFRFINRDLRQGSEVGDKFLRGDSQSETC